MRKGNASLFGVLIPLPGAVVFLLGGVFRPNFSLAPSLWPSLLGSAHEVGQTEALA